MKNTWILILVILAVSTGIVHAKYDGTVSGLLPPPTYQEENQPPPPDITVGAEQPQAVYVPDTKPLQEVPQQAQTVQKPPVVIHNSNIINNYFPQPLQVNHNHSVARSKAKHNNRSSAGQATHAKAKVAPSKTVPKSKVKETVNSNAPQPPAKKGEAEREKKPINMEMISLIAIVAIVAIVAFRALSSSNQTAPVAPAASVVVIYPTPPPVPSEVIHDYAGLQGKSAPQVEDNTHLTEDDIQAAIKRGAAAAA